MSDTVQTTTVASHQQPGISLLDIALLTGMSCALKPDSSNVPFPLNSAVSH